VLNLANSDTAAWLCQAEEDKANTRRTSGGRQIFTSRDDTTKTYVKVIICHRLVTCFKSNQIKSNGLLGIAALMLDYNNIEVMCLQLITLRVVSVDNTIAVTKITSIYTKIQKHAFKTTENKF